MPVSPMPSNATSATLQQLVAFLTRPLALAYPAQTVLQLQLFLHANLSSFFPTEHSLSPFTLLLSPAFLPPTPIYATCLQSGVAWPEWIRALGGKALYVFVMEGSLKVRVGEVGDATTIWSEHPTVIPSISKMKNQAQNDSDSPMTLKLRAMLDSVRARSSPAPETTYIISLPTLLPTVSLTRDTEVMSDSDDMSDSDSDTESTTSSRFSESSAESMTSVSSTSSSPVSKASNLPAIVSASKKSVAATVTLAKAPVYVPRHRATKISSPHPTEGSIPAQHLSRSARATVDKSKADICRYTYQGGQTGVMTGGVMLGGAKPSAPAPKTRTVGVALSSTSSVRKTRSSRRTSVLLGPDSSDWRSRA